MLPKQHRLRKSRDFSRVRRFGRSSGSPLVALYVLPMRTPDVRVGFSVSKRVGKATVRNHVKRIMREVVHHRLGDIRPGQDLVFIARAGSAEATHLQIAESIIYVLRRTNALRHLESTRNA